METVPTIPTIPAQSWNELRVEAKQSTPRSGYGVRLRWTPWGVIAEADHSADFVHPWQLFPQWQEGEGEKAGQWVASVHPGFVNGRDVTIQQTDPKTKETKPVALTDETPPLLAFVVFRNPAGAAGLGVSASGRVVQTAGEGYPEYFAQLGAVETAKAGPLADNAPDPSRTRQIRACDVVLITPRMGTRQTLTIEAPILDSQAVQIGTTFQTGALGRAPSAHRLETRAKHQEPREPTALERLQGIAEEPEADEIRLATVYFLSPPDAPEDAEPGDDWEVYPVYAVFWNLAHASKAKFPETPPEPIRFDLPLIGGLTQGAVNFLLSPQNDASAQIAAFLGAANFRGMYWAPSGIGLATTTRPEPAASQTPAGLDPRTRRLQKESADAEDIDPAPLNPEFPFLRTPFDPSFFEMQEFFQKREG